MIKEVLLREYPFGDIKPLICGEENCKPEHVYGPSTRPYYLLHYVLSGKGYFENQNSKYAVTKGDIFVIRPFEVIYYKADKKDPWHYCWVGFEMNLPCKSYLEEDIIRLPQGEHIFRALKDSDAIGEGKELYVCSKIYELLAQLETRQIGDKKSGKAYIDKAKNYIMANYMKDIGVEDLATKLGLERSYFSTLFKKHIGKSPQEYLVEFRLMKAAELMVMYDYRPGEAAVNVGYADIYNFSKMFKKKFGISPTAYKMKHHLDSKH